MIELLEKEYNGEGEICIAMDRASKRIYDTNGWPEILDNPLSKAGVFPYLGKNLPVPGLEPNKVYYVYRPVEELSDPDFIDSVKLMPWIDEHIMLGNKGVPAEEKGVEGTIGEKVYFNKSNETLYGNLKLFSNDLQYKIDFEKKKELSLGYIFRLEVKSGVHKGQSYNFIQRKLRANHLALVEKGRMGPEVAVQDENDISLTNTGGNTMTEEEKKKLAEAEARVKADLQGQIKPLIAEAMDEAKKELFDGDAMDGYMGKMMEGMMPRMMGAMMENMMPMMMKMLKDMMGDNYGMDSADVPDPDSALIEENTKLKEELSGYRTIAAKAEKTSLYEDVSAVVGAFDHDDMDINAVAKYGIDKLGLDCDDESLQVTLLRNHLKNLPEGYTFAQDKQDTKPVIAKSADAVNTFIKGG